MGVYIKNITKDDLAENGALMWGKRIIFIPPEDIISVPDHGRLADLDQMAFDESEAYINAQNNFEHDDLTRMLNKAVHLKVMKLIADTPTVIEAERSEE